jgi:hypothetical protein
VKKGRTYFLPHQAVTTLVVKKSPATTLVLGTDYTADTVAGWVHFLASGVTLTDGDAILVSYGHPVLTRKAVSGFAVKRINASLRYVGASADGQKLDARIWNMLIKPGGPFPMIQPPSATEYGRWSIRGDVLTDAVGAYGGSADYPFYQMVEVGQVSA